MNAAVANVAQFVRNKKLALVQDGGGVDHVVLELPRVEPEGKLRLVRPDSIVFDADETLMLRIIEAYYRDTFAVAMQFPNASYVKSFYHDATQIELAQFLETIGQSIWRREAAPGVVFEAIALLDELASMTYEGEGASMTVMLRHSRGKARGGIYLGRDLLASKKTARLFSGEGYVISANLDGILLGTEAPTRSPLRWRRGTYPVASNYQSLAAFADDKRAMILTLAANGDISVLADRRTVAVRQHGKWKLVGTSSFVQRLSSMVAGIGHMSTGVATETANVLTMLALSLNHRRAGALLVVVPSSIPAKLRSSAKMSPIEKAYQELLTPRPLTSLPISLLLAAMSLDGATFISGDRMIIAFGQILATSDNGEIVTEGARTRAAATASKHGLALKISADGPITLYADGRVACELLSQAGAESSSVRIESLF